MNGKLKEELLDALLEFGINCGVAIYSYYEEMEEWEKKKKLKSCKNLNKKKQELIEKLMH